LLSRNQDSVLDNYNKLRNLGISSHKLASYAGLLSRNPKSLEGNFHYLTEKLLLEVSKVLGSPQILAENPDAFPKKMRILKLIILGLKRRNLLNPNDYYSFWFSSPATLLAKKKFCIDNRIDYIQRVSILLGPWHKLIRLIEPSVSKTEADKRGAMLTKPFKHRYDIWMKEYKKYGENFFIRRKRRIISRV
ncbi:MAG: hypothetical protein ACW99E_17970, partial [Promethearchaeota archaeon]